jgi:hypothetical protein
MTKQVVCVKWGVKYDATYVNRLYAMVQRNLTPPFRFVCLTDSRAGIRPEVECFDLPELGCPHPVRTFGMWKKVVLWGREVPGLTGVALFIDLDSVIVGSLDDYFTYGEPGDVILARNWALPMSRMGQTSVFRYPVGANPHILEDFRADPQGIADRFHYEQHYMTHAVKGGIKFWPKGWTRHFRLSCLPSFPLRLFVRAGLPKDARIVTFPGGPNPQDILLGRWNGKTPPHRGRLQHLLATFGTQRAFRRRWRHFRSYVLPVPWIAEHWRE